MQQGPRNSPGARPHDDPSSASASSASASTTQHLRGGMALRRAGPRATRGNKNPQWQTIAIAAGVLSPDALRQVQARVFQAQQYAQSLVECRLGCGTARRGGAFVCRSLQLPAGDAESRLSDTCPPSEQQP